MSDRIAVMRAGRIEQLGEADALYERPRNRFVAPVPRHVQPARGRVGGERPASWRRRRSAAARRPPRRARARRARSPSPSGRRRSPRSPGEAGREPVPGTVEQLIYIGSATHYVLGAGRLTHRHVMNAGARAARLGRRAGDRLHAGRGAPGAGGLMARDAVRRPSRRARSASASGSRAPLVRSAFTSGPAIGWVSALPAPAARRHPRDQLAHPRALRRDRPAAHPRELQAPGRLRRVRLRSAVSVHHPAQPGARRGHHGGLPARRLPAGLLHRRRCPGAQADRAHSGDHPVLDQPADPHLRLADPARARRAGWRARRGAGPGRGRRGRSTPACVAVYLGMLCAYLPFLVLPLYASVEKLDWSSPRPRPTSAPTGRASSATRSSRRSCRGSWPAWSWCSSRRPASS